MKKITFEAQAFEDFNQWSQKDKKIHRKIIDLIKSIQRTPFEGIGKPEPLKYELTGFWSRRIDQENRLVYMVTEIEIIIASCKYHY